jgi:hypothetical protein
VFLEDSAFANVDESRLECAISSWKRRAQFTVRAEAVGRVTSQCNVWPERIQQWARRFGAERSGSPNMYMTTKTRVFYILLKNAVVDLVALRVSAGFFRDTGDQLIQS